MKTCRCCTSAAITDLFRIELLGRNVAYYECKNCGYVQTEKPTWLDEAYASPINTSDTGIMSRNLANTPLVLATLAMMGCRRSHIVDYAGGHGLLVRLLRDIGIDALWFDPFSENLVARGFEYQEKTDCKIELLTAFEVLEHFVNPAEEMTDLLSVSTNILFTTTLAPLPTPLPKDWWYYGFDHGQHIFFYRVRTLQYLADRFGLNLLTDGVSTHFFSAKKYSYFVWKTYMRAASFMPKLFALGLPSKTWSDYLEISMFNDSLSSIRR